MLYGRRDEGIAVKAGSLECKENTARGYRSRVGGDRTRLQVYFVEFFYVLLHIITVNFRGNNGLGGVIIATTNWASLKIFVRNKKIVVPLHPISGHRI